MRGDACMCLISLDDCITRGKVHSTDPDPEPEQDPVRQDVMDGQLLFVFLPTSNVNLPPVYPMNPGPWTRP